MGGGYKRKQYKRKERGVGVLPSRYVGQGAQDT